MLHIWELCTTSPRIKQCFKSPLLSQDCFKTEATFLSTVLTQLRQDLRSSAGQSLVKLWFGSTLQGVCSKGSCTCCTCLTTRRACLWTSLTAKRYSTRFQQDSRCCCSRCACCNLGSSSCCCCFTGQKQEGRRGPSSQSISCGNWES